MVPDISVVELAIVEGRPCGIKTDEEVMFFEIVFDADFVTTRASPEDEALEKLMVDTVPLEGDDGLFLCVVMTSGTEVEPEEMGYV